MAQFTCNLRDESYESSYSMIGQYLSNTNESATVALSKNFWQLNKALVDRYQAPFLHENRKAASVSLSLLCVCLCFV